MIRKAILTCNKKLTWVSLIYRKEQTTKSGEKTRKSKKQKSNMLRSIGKQSRECVESVLKKGYRGKEGFKPKLKEGVVEY